MAARIARLFFYLLGSCGLVPLIGRGLRSKDQQSSQSLARPSCCPLLPRTVQPSRHWRFITLPILTRWKPCKSTASLSYFAHPRTRLFRYSLLWRSHAHPGCWLASAFAALQGTARCKLQNENVTRGKEHRSEGKHGVDVDPLGLCARSERCRQCYAKCTSHGFCSRRLGLRLLLASPSFSNPGTIEETASKFTTSYNTPARPSECS